MTDPLLQKLNLGEHAPVFLINAPEDIKSLFADRPFDEHQVPHRKYPFILAFFHSLDEAKHLAGNLVTAYVPGGYLWLAYPKAKAREFRGESYGDLLWSTLAPFDFEPVAALSLKKDWNLIQFRHIDEIRLDAKKETKGGRKKEKAKEKKPVDPERAIAHGDVVP